MSGAQDDDVERIALTLPEMTNPFKKAFDAGQNLRSTLADTLGQITGTASPVSACLPPACVKVYLPLFVAAEALDTPEMAERVVT